MSLDDLKAALIHALGGVTAEEWEQGLRLPKPIKAMLADMTIHIKRERLEWAFRVGAYHHADVEAARSAFLEHAAPPAEESPELAELAASNAAFRARQQPYAAQLETIHEQPVVSPFGVRYRRLMADEARRRRG